MPAYAATAVPELTPGNFDVTVRMGGTHGGDVAHFLDATLRADLRPGQATERTVPLTRGGRIEFTVQAPDGRTDIVCHCRLTNAQGQTLGVLFTKVADGRMMSLTGAIGDMTGVAYVDETLPPGRYTLRIEPQQGGFATREIEIEVRPGETASPVVQLR